MRTLPGALWSGLVGGALWLIPHSLELAAPQVGALAMNTQKLYWLSLPLFGLGLLAGRSAGCEQHPVFRSSRLPSVSGSAPWWRLRTIPWIAVAFLPRRLVYPRQQHSGGGRPRSRDHRLADGWLETPSSVRSRSAIWARASQAQQLATWTAPRAGLEMTQHGLTDAGSFIVWKNKEKNSGSA